MRTNLFLSSYFLIDGGWSHNGNVSGWAQIKGEKCPFSYTKNTHRLLSFFALVMRSVFFGDMMALILLSYHLSLCHSLLLYLLAYTYYTHTHLYAHTHFVVFCPNDVSGTQFLHHKEEGPIHSSFLRVQPGIFGSRAKAIQVMPRERSY